MEESLLSLSGSELLNVVDDKHIYRLIEVYEVILSVIAHRINKLRFEKMCRNIEYTLIGIELQELVPNGRNKVSFAHSAGTVEEERVECLSRMLCDGKSHSACQLIALSLHKIVERKILIEVRIQRR